MRRTARPWQISLTVEGLNSARFLRQAGEQGIRLTGVRRAAPRKLTALAAEDALPALQELALRGGWKLKTGRRRGLGRAAEWLMARWLLAAMLAMACVVLFAASQVMWRVEIENGGTYAADILSALEELGVQAPRLRSQISLGELRDALEWRYPRIAWFECGWRGSTLVIRPVEGVLPLTERNHGGACDVVAMRDGVVHSIVTRAGTPVVKVGDIVRAGEVLIKGEERTSDGAVKSVAARGSVIARVWQGASVSMSAIDVVTSYTGRTETVWTLRTPWFDLWQMKASAFSRYDTSVTQTPVCDIFLPVTLHVETRMEAEYTCQQRDHAQLEAEAWEAARRKLQEKVGAEESLIDIWGNCSMIDAENLLSVAIGEMLVEIGRQVPASGMAVPAEQRSE